VEGSGTGTKKLVFRRISIQEEQEYTIPQMVEDVRSGKLLRRNFIKALTAMGISAAGVGVIVAATSAPSISTAISHVNAKESVARHTQFHNQHLAHQASGNMNALQNDYAEGAVVEDSMHREAFVGKDAIMARKDMITAAASHADITVINRVVVGNQVTAEWIATGIHTGDLPGLPASGLPFSLRGVTVVIREHDKIVREALYYDVAELYRQLGINEKFMGPASVSNGVLYIGSYTGGFYAFGL
jgi:steroid delta-isomerase-like uncharacterized protein